MSRSCNRPWKDSQLGVGADEPRLTLVEVVLIESKAKVLLVLLDVEADANFRTDLRVIAEQDKRLEIAIAFRKVICDMRST